MYCKNCGVHVDGIYDVCPLCKTPLEGEPAERPLYPEKHIRKIGHPVTFSSVYLIVALLINVICIAVNLTVARKYLWCVFALILTLYGYFTLKTTVFYKGPNATIGRIISVHAPAMTAAAGTIPRRHVIHIYLKNDLPFLLRKAPTKTRCRAIDDMTVTGIA